jgi:ribose transport system ATP-binding protein
VSEAAAPLAIEALDIRKSFSGVPALRGCNLRVRGGEVHALLGQNGAGKSTLVKILNGVHPAGSFEGAISVQGRVVRFQSPAQARESGVGYVPQEIEVVENLDVAENIFAGQTNFGRGIVVRWKSLQREADRVLQELGLTFSSTTLVASLSAAQRHLVMIARALVANPAVLILDEPTASLSANEIQRLFDVLRRLKERGTTIIYITHRLPEVIAICDRASILRDGLIEAEYVSDTFKIDALIAQMSGRKIDRQFPERMPPSKTVLMKVEELAVVDRGRVLVKHVSFELAAGEILGIAGLLGAGRTELLNAIYGRFTFRGQISIEGKPCAIDSVQAARKAGISLLTEDRKRDGLLFNLPVRGNVTAGNLSLVSSLGIVRRLREYQLVEEQMTQLTIKASSMESDVMHLSGGNQQKLLFARSLLQRPKILLLDEPSKGVDVTTRHEIYRLITGLAASGLGVIMVSSELEEVLGVAHRCLVMSDGRFIEAFSCGERSEEYVLQIIAADQKHSMDAARAANSL